MNPEATFTIVADGSLTGQNDALTLAIDNGSRAFLTGLQK